MIALTHEELQQFQLLAAEYKKLMLNWNALVQKINDKGGQEFLDSAMPRFSPSELKLLISLCHPDKHGGSKAAEEITRKLLEMRG